MSETGRIVMIVCLVVDIPLWILIGKVMFGDMATFLESIRFMLTPDILSMIRGEWTDDVMAETRGYIFLAACAGLVGLEYWAISEWIA